VRPQVDLSRFKAFTLSPAETEIRAWAQRNREALMGRSAYEVAELAILCGFDKEAVYRTFSTFRHAMWGGHIENAAMTQEMVLEMTLERIFEMREALENPERVWVAELWQDLVAQFEKGE
jgi:hypothetical protein